MRMRETWLALSRTKKTVMFSSETAPISLPPREALYDGLITLKIGTTGRLNPDDLWFAVSEESMHPDPGAH